MFKELNILKPFLEDPQREFNVRELARIVKITPATASKKLKLFSKKGILSHRKERILDLYKANLDNSPYTDLKTYYNIRKIRDSDLIEELNKFYLKPSIVLFGSASLGLDTKSSDIDLLIISENKENFDVKKFEKRLNRNIQLFIEKSLKEIKNKHLIRNILNGMILQGEIKWT